MALAVDINPMRGESDPRDKQQRESDIMNTMNWTREGVGRDRNGREDNRLPANAVDSYCDL